MQISIKDDLKRLTKDLTRLQKKQIPAATQWALNGTAKKIKLAQEREVNRVFKNPTRFIQRSFWIRWAKKTRLEAKVSLKDEAYKSSPATKILDAEIVGGQRKHKPFETLLIAKGQMPRNMYAVPSRTIKKNRFGNVTGGQITKILSGLSAQRDVYQNASPGSKRSKTAGKFFSGIVGNVHGIWDVNALQKGRPALLFLFVKKTKYRVRFNFDKVGFNTMNAVYKREFDKALKKALATAR